jgi:hypothetical protein
MKYGNTIPEGRRSFSTRAYDEQFSRETLENGLLTRRKIIRESRQMMAIDSPGSEPG